MRIIVWKYQFRFLCMSTLLAASIPISSFAQHEGHNHSEIDEAPSVQQPAPMTAAHSEHRGETSLAGLSSNRSGEEQTEETSQIWTCSMHPQIRLPKPGKCPICGMALIPVAIEDSSADSRSGLKMSDYSKALAEIQTTEVKHLSVSKDVRLVGFVDYDETLLKHITAWVPGRIDRLYVDYTGISVKKGDHMVYLYSPELISAQEELIQSKKTLGRLNANASTIVRTSTARSVKAAREKLRLLGLSESQVHSIEKSGKSSEWITIYSPIGGVVLQKHVNEGMYVKTGSQIYTIADLSHLWLYLDAYESDLPWIRYGQKVEFSSEALPGETFVGMVSFIKPFLDPNSRTVKVRVNVDNSKALLKPGMFATATINSLLSDDGTAHAPSFAGKYLCPMHPEIVSDSPGNCSICGMDLVKANSLPFIGKQHQLGTPLVIPASAPLITGHRAVVYVENEDTGKYSGREVVLGPRAGDYYLVKSGLSAGEKVVTKGNFKLDADLQIQGKSSMMNPEGGVTSSGHAH